MPGKSKYTIEDAIRIAQGRGGMCLSTEYKNNRTKMLWQCDKLHEPWEAVFKEINISGTWCPKCAGKITYTIDDCHKVAKERNGVCLSTEYINTDTKMLWQCDKLHEPWEADFGHIQSRGSWCPFCSGRTKYNLEVAKNMAIEKGGVCLSTEYINVFTNMKWQCSIKHIWETKFTNIVQGRWCPICSNSIPNTIQMAHELAAKKNGKCLSTEYKNNKTQLLWQCSKNHTPWKARYDAIHNGTWCPTCSNKVSFYEELTKQLCYHYFDIMPITTRRIVHSELDCYIKFSDNTQVDFEIHGEQHFKFKSKFHKSIDDLNGQKSRDEKRRLLCYDANIILIEIPTPIRKNKDTVDKFIDKIEEIIFCGFSEYVVKNKLDRDLILKKVYS